MPITILTKGGVLIPTHRVGGQSGSDEYHGACAFASTSTSGTVQIPLKCIEFISIQKIGSANSGEDIQPTAAVGTALVTGRYYPPTGDGVPIQRLGTATSGLKFFITAKGYKS